MACRHITVSARFYIIILCLVSFSMPELIMNACLIATVLVSVFITGFPVIIYGVSQTILIAQIFRFGHAVGYAVAIGTKESG